MKMTRHSNIERAAAPINWIVAILMAIGLFAPFAATNGVAAAPTNSNLAVSGHLQQRDGASPPLDGVLGVTIVGDVANVVGPVTLTPNGDGSWTGAAALDSGSYQYQVSVSTNSGEVVLGENGESSPPANPLTVNVPDGSSGALFSFDENTGQTTAGGLVMSLSTDSGQLTMMPDSSGNYEVYFNVQPGTTVNVESVLLGTPTGQTAQVTDQGYGRIHVVVDQNGAIQTAESVETGSLTIFKTDDAGTPLAGACFAAYGQGNAIAAQACDSTDGASDGSTTLGFPNGVPGNVEVVETFTPDGQNPSDSQSFNVVAGENQLQMTVASVAGDTVVPEGPTYTLTFQSIDLNGAPLGGACYAIDDNPPVCDDDFDGTVSIPNVPAGPHTLTEPTPPEGYEAYPDYQLDVTRDEAFSVPHNVATGPPAEPTEAGPVETTSTVNLTSIDENGNLVPFACFSLDGGDSVCDDDGDGVTTFTEVPTGQHSISETQAPDGFQPVADFVINVANEVEDETVQHAALAEPTAETPIGANVGFVAIDANQAPLPGACYTLDGGSEQCDDDGDGVVTFENVQIGLHTLEETQAPDGYQNVGPLQVDVQGEQNFAVRHELSAEPTAEPTEETSAEPTEQATEEPQSGFQVGFVSVDQDDNALPGACYSLNDGDPVCDDDGDGEVTFTGVQPGQQTLTETTAPAGFEINDPLSLNVEGDGRFAIRHTASESEEVTGTGAFVAVTRDQDGNELSGVCYDISELGQQCDGDDPDNVMTQTEVPAGDYTINLVVPDGYEGAGPTEQTVTVTPGETSNVEFQVQLVGGGEVAPGGGEEPAVGAGSMRVVPTDQGFPIPGACVTYDGPDSGQVCDNDQNDGDPDSGPILISNLAVGAYEVSMPEPPEGFAPAGPVSANVQASQQTEVDLAAGEAAEPTPEQPAIGDFRVIKRDPNGKRLSGACFSLVGEQTFGPFCDGDGQDTDDRTGVMEVQGLPAGDYTLTETQAPDGYAIGPDQAVTINPGERTSVTISDELATGALSITKTDPDGNPFAGACFTVDGGDALCDGDDNDGDPNDGSILISDLSVGSHEIAEQPVDGFVTPDPQTVDIAAGETATATFVNAPATGSVAITKTDADGNPFAGACFTVDGDDAVCDGDDNDGDGNDGSILISDLSVGSHEIAEQPIEGYATPASQTVDVTAGATATATFVNVALPGSLTISKSDGDGNPLAGACFSVGDETICDNGDGDENADDGIVTVSGLAAGTIDVSETSAPDGYVASTNSQSVEITAGGTAEVSFTNQLETGSLQIEKVDQDGNPLAGSCFTVSDETICDGDDRDSSSDDGIIEISNLPVGDVNVSESTAPEGYVASDEAQTVTIKNGETASARFVNGAEQGTLRITKVDPDGNAIEGACFLVGSIEVCDGADNDDAPNSGTVEIDLAVGEYQVQESQAPDGFVAAPDPQTVEITADDTADLTFENQPAVGSLMINKVDVLDLSKPLAGACFDAEGGPSVCDNDELDQDPDDGKILVNDIPVGTYQLTESKAPEGYAPGATVSVDIAAGETTSVTVGNTASPGGLRIVKVDADDGSVVLSGACFSIDDGDPVCDNSDGDASDDEGTVEIQGLEAGDHQIVETTAPDGYVAGEPTSVQTEAGQTAEITITNTRAEGTIRIEKTDEQSGESLAGACFAIDDGDPVCDNDAEDGDSSDGVIVLTAVPGEHLVTETQAPDGFQATADPQSVTVENGGRATVSFTNSQFTGSLAITKLNNTDNEPLGGACFALQGDNDLGPVCDNGEGDADPDEGALLIQGLQTGTYDLVETTTPDGFAEPDGPVSINVQINPGETTSVEVANDPEGSAVLPAFDSGAVSISIVDDAGDPLADACFTLSSDSSIGPICDNGEGDSDSVVGVIQIDEVPVGAYSVEQNQAQEGYTNSPVQQIDVAASQTTEISVVNTTEVSGFGNLRIRSVDDEGTLLGGGCYSDGANAVCDNQAGDADPAPGEILVTGLQVGSYTITPTQPPTGFTLSEPQQVEIAADTETLAEFVHEPAEVQTGSLEFQLTDPDGNPVEGGCVALSQTSNEAQDFVFCDGGPEDQDPTPAVLLLNDLPVGAYSVSQASVPGADNARVDGVSFKVAVVQAGQDAATIDPSSLPLSEKTVVVKSNVTIIVIIIIIVEPPSDGSLEIIKRADDTNLLQANACFKAVGQGNSIEICDNDGADANNTIGVIRFTDLAEGSYTVSETQAPPGYDPASDQVVQVIGGVKTAITIKDKPTPDPIGSLTILKVDKQGDLISGTCFELLDGDDVIAGPTCDIDDGADDGAILFENLTPGDYMVHETQAASDDYQPIADQPVTIVAGVDAELPVVNEFKPGSILIVKLDQDGNGPLAGACFGLDRGSGIEYEVCDQKAGDSDLEEGIISIKNVPPGDYTLVETVAPPGFDPGSDTPITVEPNKQTQLDVKNTPSIPPTETGDLTIQKKDPKGNPLPGSCFALKQGQIIKVAAVCDGDDGSNDGTLTFSDIGVGSYSTVETKKPSADYQLAPVKFVTISKDQTTTVSITNIYKPGRILVQKVNAQDHALANACFKVTPGTSAIKCSDGSGNVVFDNLSPGVYTVTETSPPFGYLSAPPVTNIVVKPGLTSPIKIVDKKAPPPPDAGSIRLIKFFCPLPENSTELTKIFDSSDPGTQALAQTANCKKGDATFVLTPKTGEIKLIKVSTGDDGEAQLTLPAGVYTLTEQNSDVSVEVQIFVGQQTTVVVLNYVKPPPPAPVSINVYKYTCDPGFQGQYYLDFIGGCGNYESLTNNVTFRIDGVAIASRITGAAGERGRALFTQLPSGQYTLSEDVPPGVGTVFAWCGLQIESSEYGAIGPKISFPLASGQTMWCAFFNVPDEVTDTTGVIVVHKYACALPQVKRPVNFDWFAECDVQTTPAKFGLSEMQEGQFVPKSSGVTDINGLLKFSDLKQGTYKLEELGGDWCHAESDTVDAQGNVLVKAGHRSNVWIFNCVPTVEPPNTGTGSAAGLQISAGSEAAAEKRSTTAMVAMWPAALVLGLVSRRKKRTKAA